MKVVVIWSVILALHLFLLWVAYDIGFDRGYNKAKGWDE